MVRANETESTRLVSRGQNFIRRSPVVYTSFLVRVLPVNLTSEARFGPAVVALWNRGLSIIATAAASIRRFAIPRGSTKRGSAVGGQRRRFVRQRVGRNDYRTLPDRRDPPSQSLATSGRGGIHHLGVGRLVQSSSAARADRLHPACGARVLVLSLNESAADGGLTQNRMSPESRGGSDLACDESRVRINAARASRPPRALSSVRRPP